MLNFEFLELNIIPLPPLFTLSIDDCPDPKMDGD